MSFSWTILDALPSQRVKMRAAGNRIVVSLSIAGIVDAGYPSITFMNRARAQCDNKILDAAAKEIQTREEFLRCRRLADESHSAQRKAELCAAVVNELASRRQRVLLESRPGLAKQLLVIDRDLATARRERGDAEAEVQVLADSLSEARVAVQKLLHNLVEAARGELHAGILLDRQEKAAALVAAAGPALEGFLVAEYTTRRLFDVSIEQVAADLLVKLLPDGGSRPVVPVPEPTDGGAEDLEPAAAGSAAVLT